MRTAAAEFQCFADRYGRSIPEMFAAVSDLYAKYWHEYFHFAVFNGGQEDWESAFDRTHRMYIRDLKVAEARSVLDLACGRGRFTDLLAQHARGPVLGIDISQAQLRHARRLKRPNLSFKRHDVMGVDRLGCTFDAVSLLDAACYLPDKEEAVARIARVMNRGARLLIVDWCKRERLGSLQEELVLHPFMRAWAIPGLETPSRYLRHFRRHGLEVLEAQDLNGQVKRNWEFAYESAIRAVREVRPAKLARFVWKGLALGPRGIRMAKDQFAAALYIKAAFDASFLRYQYFLVRKA